MQVIKRDPLGLAQTEFCRELPDGGLDLHVGDIRYQLSPERIADGAALGQTLLDLQEKEWFTDAVQRDLTNVVTARWMAKQRGWI
jgi:hypothetical protein